MTDQKIFCLYCQRNEEQVPLITLRYQGVDAWICAQHLPILIHKPAELADKLPGLAELPPVDHHHEP